MYDPVPANPAIPNGRADAILEKDDKPIRLKPSFLLPLAVVLFGLMFTFVFLTFNSSQKQIRSSSQETVRTVSSMFSIEIIESSSMLAAVSHALIQNKDIEAAFIAQDRSRLLSLSLPLFAELSKDHLITHFYFHDTDRINLLRVHKPERFGDRINRFTMIESESIGATSSGIELGLLGTFTIRHVAPWYDARQKLIGYLELGMEIDNVFESIEQLHNIDLYLFINKKYLNKNQWIEGMGMLGYDGDWDALDQYVVTNLSKGESLPSALTMQYKQNGIISQKEYRFDLDHRKHEAKYLPIEDKGKRNVGVLWMLIDIDNEITNSYEVTLLSSGVGITLGMILFFIFFRLVDGIELELKKHQRALRLVATNDGLTGIYNRRSFDIIIASEVDRTNRYKRELSLLIIDIDHFKRVNDNFGHMAGDTVLRKLSGKLAKQLRSNDYLARYGGEEFAIILPETSLNTAHILAERIRKAVGEQDYDLGNEQSAPITISIGIASFSSQAKTVDQLILNADSALYEAKETGRNRVCDFV